MDFYILIQVFLVFILPVLLINLKIVDVKYRLYILFLMPFLVIIFIIYDKMSFYDLGFRLDNLFVGVMPYLFLTLLGVFGIYLFAKIIDRKIDKSLIKKDPHFFLLLFIPISIIQQFMFEAFLLNKLLVVFDPFFAIIFTALIFAYMHTIYPGVYINFPLAFIGGFLFTQTYYFFPNIILASIMHMCLNPVAVLYDFFIPSKNNNNFNKDKKYLFEYNFFLKHKNYFILFLGVILVVFVIFYFLDNSIFFANLLVDTIKSSIEFNYIISFLLFFLFCVVLINSPFSLTAILKVAAGYFYGFFIGCFAVLFGFFIACMTGFFISRKFFRVFFLKKYRDKLISVEKEFQKNGFYYFLSLRTIVIVPHYIINILGGVSKIKTRDFALSTFIGLIPETILYVYLGSLISNINNWGNMLNFNIFILLGLFALIGIIPGFVKYLTYRLVKK